MLRRELRRAVLGCLNQRADPVGTLLADQLDELGKRCLHCAVPSNVHLVSKLLLGFAVVWVIAGCDEEHVPAGRADPEKLKKEIERRCPECRGRIGCSCTRMNLQLCSKLVEQFCEFDINKVAPDARTEPQIACLKHVVDTMINVKDPRCVLD